MIWISLECNYTRSVVQEDELDSTAVLTPLLSLEDSLLKCGSNATWWAPGQLAFAAPFSGMHFLKILDVTTGECIMLADTCWLLPGMQFCDCWKVEDGTGFCSNRSCCRLSCSPQAGLANSCAKQSDMIVHGTSLMTSQRVYCACIVQQAD